MSLRVESERVAFRHTIRRQLRQERRFEALSTTLSARNSNEQIAIILEGSGLAPRM